MIIYHEPQPFYVDEILTLDKGEVCINLGLDNSLTEKNHDEYGYYDSGPVVMAENWWPNLNKFIELVKRK